MIERQSITGYPARSGTCPMARPMVCPLRDRRGCADGRWADRLASTVTLMPGQIWVAKGVRGRNRLALGSLACVAMFWSSAASVGRSRLPCQWCVAPLHGSAQPNEPRPKCPGDPASRFYSTPIVRAHGASTCVRHSGSRPKICPFQGRFTFPVTMESGLVAELRHGRVQRNTVTRLPSNDIHEITDADTMFVVMQPASLAKFRRVFRTWDGDLPSGLKPDGTGQTKPHTSVTCVRPVRVCLTCVTVWIVSFPLPQSFMSKDSQNSTKPLKTFRFRGVSASVFENETDKGELFHKVSIVRTYKDGKRFHTTPTFSRDELPIVTLVAQQAYDFILTEERDARRADDAE